MPKSHNKKRNVGIVYELLLRRVSECLVNEDKKGAQQTLDIISKRFKKGTELYKEFRLFRALAKSQVSDTSIAAAIITEAKSAARKTNVKALEKEKSALIREMNYTLRDDDLYRRYIPDYKSHATIQILLNDWRDGDAADLTRMAIYESKIIEHLLEEKNNNSLESHTNHDVDSLVVKIMSEKLNSKYKDKFDKNQQEILKLYSFSNMSPGSHRLAEVKSILDKIKTDSLKSLESLESSTENRIISSKISAVREKIVNESTDKVDDNKIVRFLTLIDLCKEIKENA